MKISKIRYSRPRTYLKDCYVLLHLPRYMYILCFMIISTMLVDKIFWDRFILEIIAVSAAVLLSAYRLDELKGRHVSSNIPELHHKITATIGLSIAVPIGLYLIITISWTLLIWMLLGGVGVVFYNLELGGKATHNFLLFSITWAAIPIMGSYYLHTLSLTPTVIAVAVFAMIFAWLHISSYGLTQCKHSHTCKEYNAGERDRICHGFKCANRLIIPKEIHKYQWGLINIQFYLIISITAIFVVDRFLSV